jgi:hypothetical protein
MRTLISIRRKGRMFSITLGLLMAVSILISAQRVRANDWDDGDGNTTICKDTASRNVAIGPNDSISAWEKVKVGQNVLVVFNSSVNNNLSFQGGRARVTIIQAPRPTCNFKRIIAATDAQCRLTGDHPVQVQFNCSDPGQDQYSIDDPAITPPNQLINLFNAANSVLGLGLTFPSDCNTLDNNDQKKACATAICNGLIGQLTNGNTKSLSTAGDLGALIGSMQTTLDRCAVKSIVSIQGPVTCKADDIAANTALDLLQGAPEEHLQIDSNGAGTYLVSILAGSTLFTPGDFAQINTNTCVADFLQQ